MKKLCFILPLALILCFMVGCTKEEQVERIVEDGVEVVINHLEPYKAKGEPSNLILEELFTIDTGNDEIAEIGLTDIQAFDVDSEGSIYFFQNQVQTENLVYKFDKNATFITSFGKIGQGPGEMSVPILLSITKKDEIRIKDNRKPFLSFFDKNGNLIKEIRITILEPGPIGRFTFISLENGNYLVQENFTNPTTRQRFRFLYLVDSKFEKLKELDEMDTGLSRQFAEKIKVTSNFVYKVSNEMIYAGNENRGYEILIYDLNGKLLRKIRKEYIPVDAPEEFKEAVIASSPPSFIDKLHFDKMPPFHYFFLDEKGRLYVKTYEKGDKKGEYMHDIFDSNGIFFTRKSMAGYGDPYNPQKALNRAKAKNNRLYCIKENECGFKELVVYKMSWE